MVRKRESTLSIAPGRRAAAARRGPGNPIFLTTRA